jgi:uncharacterized membrane protein YhaH (DUF805 family)
LALLIWFIAYVVVLAGGYGIAMMSSSAMSILIACAIVLFPSLVSNIAIGVKRLHDRDKSGWWLLLFYPLPVVLDRIGSGAGSVGAIFSLASFAISIWAIVELGCLRGTDGPNAYGPDPLQAGAAQPA